MAARARHATATPAPSSRGPAGNTQLPEYERPSFSLNPAAQRALASLLQRHNTKRFEDNIDTAQTELGTAIGDIYERVNRKGDAVSKRRKRFDDGRPDEEDRLKSQEEALDKLQQKAKSMNERMEEQMRKLIDAKASVSHMQEAVAAAAEDARVNASTQASTQPGRSLRNRRNHRDESGEDEDEDEEVPDFTPTDPAGGTQPPTAPKEVFQKQLELAKLRHQGQSLTERYAENEKYAQFKRILHDGLYPDDEVELAPPDQWFDEGGRPAPGVATRTQAEDDSDDDIAIERTKISTRCPITLKEFEIPVSSRKCPHVFEKSVIEEWIKGSSTRNAQGKTYLRCPVPGCTQELTKEDVYTDPVMTRRIKRIQAARQAAEEDDDEDDDQPAGTQRRGHVIDSDALDIDQMDDLPQSIMKPEPRSSGMGGTHQQQSNGPPRPSQVIDMADDESDEDEDEDMLD